MTKPEPLDHILDIVGIKGSVEVGGLGSLGLKVRRLSWGLHSALVRLRNPTAQPAWDLLARVILDVSAIELRPIGLTLEGCDEVMDSLTK